MLFLDKFTSEEKAVLPYEEIGQGICLAYDYDSIKSGTVASVRRERLMKNQREKAECLIIDGINFQESWFGLEIALPENFKKVTLKMRAYPSDYLYPKVFYDGGEHELMSVTATSKPFTHHFSMMHLEMTGLPKDAKNPRLTMFVPNAQWFSLALFEVRMRYG